MSVKTLTRVLLAASFAALVMGAWVYGKQEGVKQATAAVASGMSSVEAQGLINNLQFQLARREQELLALEARVTADSARTNMLLQQLETEMRETGKVKKELNLYRRIESGDQSRSIAVESLALSENDEQLIDLTLIQWQGRDRVAGEVRVTFHYAQGKPLARNVTSTFISGKQARGSQSGRVPHSQDVKPVSFDFRFFQTLQIPIPAGAADNGPGSGNEEAEYPDSIEVQIIPKDSRLKRTRLNVPWKAVSE